MKSKLILLIALFCLPLVPHSVAAGEDPRSFDMVLTGVNGLPPPATTSLAFRKMIGQFVTDQNVARYFQLAPPAGGGFHVCLDPQEPGGYDAIVFALQSISPGSMARWSVTLVTSCQPAPSSFAASR